MIEGVDDLQLFCVQKSSLADMVFSVSLSRYACHLFEAAHDTVQVGMMGNPTYILISSNKKSSNH
jgi:hypothetical protein